MTANGINVPPGLTLTTQCCRDYSNDRWQNSRWFIRSSFLETPFDRKLIGRQFGSSKNPLLVSVRSGAKYLNARHDGHNIKSWAQ